MFNSEKFTTIIYCVGLIVGALVSVFGYAKHNVINMLIGMLIIGLSMIYRLLFEYKRGE